MCIRVYIIILCDLHTRIWSLMFIKFSQYNAPFSEPPQAGVHYISLNDQRDICLGRLDAHVRLYRSLPKNSVIELRNELTGEVHVHDLTTCVFYAPFSKNPLPVLDKSDTQFLDVLAHDCGIQAAKLRLRDLNPLQINSHSTPVQNNVYKIKPPVKIKKPKKLSRKQLLINSLLLQLK